MPRVQSILVMYSRYMPVYDRLSVQSSCSYEHPAQTGVNSEAETAQYRLISYFVRIALRMCLLIVCTPGTVCINIQYSTNE